MFNQLCDDGDSRRPAGRYMVKRIQMAGENVYIFLNTIADFTLGID